MFLPQSTVFRSTKVRPAETTIFHPDGSRLVIGELFTVLYPADGGAARIVPTPALDPDNTTLRWDLAA